MKVFSLIVYFAMLFRKFPDCLCPAMTPFFLPRNRLLRFCQLLFCPPEMPRVVYERASGESREVGNAQINAHIFIDNRKRVRLDFTGEHGGQELPFTLHRECFDG